MKTLFSTITKDIKTKALVKAYLFIIPGCALMLYMGIFLSPRALHPWGWIGFLIGTFLIAIGTTPLRRIAHLEFKPHEIRFDTESIRFVHAKKGEVVFPHSAIEKMSFVNKKTVYGIRLHLKDKRIFFLPYFSRRTYDIMKMYETDETPVI